MIISSLELRFCMSCLNRSLCIPEEYPYAEIPPDISGREFTYFKANEFLFKENEPASGIFCIYIGTIKIYHTNKNDGKEIMVKNAVDGEIIGYNSIANGKYIHSAIANQNSFACFIDMEALAELIKAHHPLTKKMIGNMVPG